MPYDGMGNWVDSKTDLRTDTLGFGEVGTVGGVGQLIYKLFRFKKYEMQNANGEILARPICRPGFEPEFFDSDGLTGADILASLYNLALKINDFSEKKPFDELIMNWCQRVAHPYFVDELAALMSEDEFDLAHESFFIERDGIFDVNDFMHDLGKLYQVASFAFALDMILKGYDDAAFNLADEGRYFEGVPFLEKYKGELPEMSDEIDDTPITPDELIKEMQEASRNAPPVHRNTIEEGFATLPYDDYYILRDKLVDMMPDFRMRLKVNRKKNIVVLAADIHSVFDIAWYTLAKKISELPLPDYKEKEEEYDSCDKPVILICPICGNAFVRVGKANRKIYCGSPECNKRRRAQNTRNCRKRQKVASMQTDGADTE